MPENQLKRYQITWNRMDAMSEDVFSSETVIDSLKKFFSEYGKQWVFQLERGSEAKRLHYQCVLHLVKRMRPKDLRAAFQANFKGARISPESKLGKFSYGMKEDTRVAGPWADVDLKQLKLRTEAAEYVYKGEDLPTELLDWQVPLYNYLVHYKARRRQIMWFVDKDGHSGKSQFVKYMAFHHNALPMSFGDQKHLFNLVVKGGPRKIYMLDLTRTKPKEYSMDDLYSTLEAIQNGLVINLHYESSTMFFVPPHVVVFANTPPLKESLSPDRWNIQEILPKHCPTIHARAREEDQAPPFKLPFDCVFSK